MIDDTKDGFFLSVYAAVKIVKGSPILFNYVKPLDTHEARAESLLNFKFFTCQCARCQDPSEFKTFNSAHSCKDCQAGPVLKNDKGDWTCQDCQAKLDTAKVNHTNLEISNAKAKLGKIQARVDLGQARDLHCQFERLLYPSHGFMLEIKQALITCTAAAVNNPGPDLEPQMQMQRVQWCEELLESLDILEPGLSIGRGKTYLFRLFDRENCRSIELLCS